MRKSDLYAFKLGKEGVKMKRIEITLKIDYEDYYCTGTNTYEYENETELKKLLINEYFKVLEIRYDPLNINSYLGYHAKDKIIEYTHEDFINDLIEDYFEIKDEDNDLYFMILDKMENSKSIEEFTSYINGLKEGLNYAE